MTTLGNTTLHNATRTPATRAPLLGGLLCSWLTLAACTPQSNAAVAATDGSPSQAPATHTQTAAAPTTIDPDGFTRDSQGTRTHYKGTKLFSGPHRIEKPLGGLTIVSYNYSDKYIDRFSVDKRWGGNVFVSSPTAGGGGGTCCMSFRAIPLPTYVTVEWQRTLGTPICTQTVLVDGPVPRDAGYFEVHFYQDGHIEAAITKSQSYPRLKLQSHDDFSRHASGNVVNDEAYSTCVPAPPDPNEGIQAGDNIEYFNPDGSLTPAGIEAEKNAERTITPEEIERLFKSKRKSWLHD